MNTSTRKSAVSPATAEQKFEMAVSAALDLGMSSDDALLAAMLGDMVEETDKPAASAADDEIFDADDEILAAGGEDEGSGFAVGDDEADLGAIEAALATIEKAESNQAVYADDAGTAEDAPEAAADLAAAPAKKDKKIKPAAPPRVTYVGHTVSEVLVAKLGEKKSELLMLEVADVTLDAAELEAKQAALLVDIDKLAKKVGEKTNMLFGWIRNGGKLNDVMARAFTILARDGELTSGKKGNLHLNLKEKFSEGTADSQGNQMFCLFPALKVTVKEKGKMVANPNSLIFMKAKAELGLA